MHLGRPGKHRCMPSQLAYPAAQSPARGSAVTSLDQQQQRPAKPHQPVAAQASPHRALFRQRQRVHAARGHLPHAHAWQAAHGGRDVALAFAGHALIVLVAAPGPALAGVVHRQHMPPAAGGPAVWYTKAANEGPASPAILQRSSRSGSPGSSRSSGQTAGSPAAEAAALRQPCQPATLPARSPCLAPPRPRAVPADGRLLDAHPLQARHPRWPAVELPMAAAESAACIPALPQGASKGARLLKHLTTLGPARRAISRMLPGARRAVGIPPQPPTTSAAPRRPPR